MATSSPTLLPTRYTAPGMPNQPSETKPAIDANRALKRGIWLYFLLLIFEGALRKWVLPGLSSPLLVVRDPLAIWLVLSARNRGLLPSTGFLTVAVAIGIIGTVTATLFGHGNLLVALYGARVLIFQFPLLFVIGRLFNQDDVIRVGKALLWMAPLMTVLIGLQFYSPQSAWVNRGVGGNMEGAGFSGTADYFRPPGTFSFTNGVSLFYSLLAPFILYFWLQAAKVPRWLLVGATVALLAAIPLSISRGLFFSVIVSLAFTLVAVARRPKYLGQLLVAVVGGAVALFILSKMGFFQTGIEAFTSRFESAGVAEGGLQGTLGNRYVGSLQNALIGSFSYPFFGYGLGLGTNVGNMLLGLSGGYAVGEGEWERLAGELGPLMGLSVVFIRLALSARLAMAGYRRLVAGDLLPWLLLSFCLLSLPQAQWAQPTSLGFSILIGGLTLASLRPSPAASPISSSNK